jgi:hypothetical protein
VGETAQPCMGQQPFDTQHPHRVHTRAAMWMKQHSQPRGSTSARWTTSAQWSTFARWTTSTQHTLGNIPHRETSAQGTLGNIPHQETSTQHTLGNIPHRETSARGTSEDTTGDSELASSPLANNTTNDAKTWPSLHFLNTFSNQQITPPDPFHHQGKAPTKRTHNR